MLPYLFLIDVAIVLLALAALLAAVRQHHRVVKHWHMLLPGLLSLGASIALVGYPRWSNVLELQRLTLAVAALLVGALRGRAMRLASDRVNKAAALRNAVDGIVVAAVQLGLAVVNLALDIMAGGLNALTPTFELILITAAAYLLGRSVTLWIHVRTSADVELLPR